MTVMEWLKSLDVPQYLEVKNMILNGRFDMCDENREHDLTYVYGYWIPCTLKRGSGDIAEILNYNDWLESVVSGR